MISNQNENSSSILFSETISSKSEKFSSSDSYKIDEYNTLLFHEKENENMEFYDKFYDD